MASPASIKNHPIHPMLVAIPIGLWIFALIADAVHVAGGGPQWADVALYCVAAGLIGAVVAAVPGLIDYFSIDEPDMKRVATIHMLVNLSGVIIFLVNLWSRFHFGPQSYVPLLLSLVGVIAVGIGGWYGGEMVYVKGMAVEPVEKLSKQVGEQSEAPRLRRVS